MKIRTQEDLYDRITADLVWRKKELAVFNSIIKRAGLSSADHRAILRGSVSMLYAHWEGFVKNSCYLYLCYINSKRLILSDLTDELAALVVRGVLSSCSASFKSAPHIEAVSRIRDSRGERANIPADRASIETRSNLSFAVFQDVMLSVGCHTKSYEIYKDLIDEQLVKSRNEVAHGEDSSISASDWQDLHYEVIFLMEMVSTDILNAAAEQTFLRTKLEHREL